MGENNVILKISSFGSTSLSKSCIWSFFYFCPMHNFLIWLIWKIQHFLAILPVYQKIMRQFYFVILESTLVIILFFIIGIGLIKLCALMGLPNLLYFVLPFWHSKPYICNILSDNFRPLCSKIMKCS